MMHLKQTETFNVRLGVVSSIDGVETAADAPFAALQKPKKSAR
jgi:hypothetical protein